jgi:acyl carrier protein
MEDPLALVRRAAKAANVLQPDGELKPIDSLDLVNLMAELETAMHREIPADAVTLENFSSVSSLAALVSSLRSDSPPTA